MTAEPAPGPGEPGYDPTELVQTNLRIPRGLRDAIDERRAQIETPDGRQISRDKWATRVFTHALRMPLPRPAPTGPSMRVAPPPHRRPPNPPTK